MKEKPDTEKRIRSHDCINSNEKQILDGHDTNKISNCDSYVSNHGYAEDKRKTMLVQSENSGFFNIEYLYKTIFEQSLFGIFTTNEHDQIISWNTYMEILLGLTKEEMYLKQVDFFYPFDEWHKLQSEYGNDKELFRRETKICTKQGRVIDIDLNLKAIQNDSGKTLGFIVIVDDISEKQRMAKFIEESEDKFRQIYENIPVPYYSINPSGDIINVNEKWCQLLGYEKNEVIAKSIYDFIVEDEKDQVKLILEQYVGQSLREGQTQRRRYITKEGSEKLFEIQDFLFFGRNNVIITIHTILRDNSEQKKKEEKLDAERKQLLSLFDCIDEIIYVVDPQSFEILYANKFLKHSMKRELIGESCYKALHNQEIPCDFCTNKIILEKNGEPYRWEYHNSVTNRDYVVTDRIIPWPDGREVRFELAVDVTKLKMALDELRDAHELLFTVNKELERKVEDRTSEIKKLIQQKDEFINQLSHDLKTPLTPVMILLPLVENTISDPKSHELLDTIKRNVTYMKELVDKTIELARLNSLNVQLEMENVNLSAKVRTIIKDFVVVLEKNQIIVENNINEHLFVKADHLKLREVFTNLLSNAIKYSLNKGDVITVDAMEEHEMVTISIKDNGIGIDSEQLPHVFDEFYKADESRHDLDSSGLGLAVSKRIIEKHGGKLWVESPGKGLGSTFYFTLPTGTKNPM